MAGLGRKEFNSGDILLASEVQGYLQDQAVMVFDDDTARGSAIPSPSEGMLTYNKDTDQLELYDGAAFGPVGSDAGLVHINRTTFSAVSAVSLPNDTFSSSYDNYRIILSISASTLAANVNFRMRASGTDESSNNYSFGLILQESTVLTDETQFNGSSGRFGEISTNTGVYSIDIFRPFLTETTEVTSFGGRTVRRLVMTYSSLSTSTSYDSLSVLFSAGAQTGTIDVYGYGQ